MKNIVSENPDEYLCIFRLVKSAINGRRADISDLTPDWKKVIVFSERMSFIALVKKGVDLLDKSQQPPQEILSVLKGKFRKAVLTDTNQLYELEILQDAFEENHTDMLLLKGTYFKQMYPDSVYRYMGDIDTYVDFENFDKADSILHSIGYTPASDIGGHDKSYHKEPYICLEQHFSLYEGNNPVLKAYYRRIKDRCIPKDGYEHILEMPIEEIYLFLTVHAVQHFNYAGIPPRIFLDYYVFHQKYQNQIDRTYIAEMLEQFGYTEFEKKAVEIAYRWFSADGSGLDIHSELDLFLADGDTYGKKEHNIGIRASKMTADGKKPSRLKFIFRQLFPSYGFMKSQNAILRNYPFLLPFVWVVYVFKRVFQKRTLQDYGNINKATSDYYKTITKAIGLENQTD